MSMHDHGLHIAAFSRGILKAPYLRTFLDAGRLSCKPGTGVAKDVDLVVGWGAKKNTAKARTYANRHALPYSALEDGFIRSVGLGRQGYPGISMVMDRTGIYYDARTPSDLESLLNGNNEVFTQALLEQAHRAMALITSRNISKYNGAPDIETTYFTTRHPRVLVIDQAAQDLSLHYGAPAATNLEWMIETALHENPDAQIYVKLHPETIAGLRAGMYSGTKLSPRVTLISDALNPISVLKQMQKVYVATSLMGFEALMLGKQVVCFGMPFYAGWGLTDDRVQCLRRKRTRTVAEVFAAAYLLYSRYVNPATGKRCDIFEAIDWLQREIDYNLKNRGDLYVFGVRRWKRAHVQPFLRSTLNTVTYVKNARDAQRKGIRPGSQIIIWGSKEPVNLESLVALTGKQPWRMEDGFIRSVGLGSDLIRAASLVIDRQGIYFDPGIPSELETILNQRHFTPRQLNEAAMIRGIIVSKGISKYNTQQNQVPDLLPATAGCKIILIAGQVEDDASVLLGSGECKTNLDLLRTVRRQNQDACILYKPHPDVLSGNRRGRIDMRTALQYADRVVTDTGIDGCIRVADELHTITSLSGFDALLRGKKVVTYGLPFYAGWGLTEDHMHCTRRTARLSLEQLVAGALIVYPRYHDWQRHCWTDCRGVLRNVIDRQASLKACKQLSFLQPTFIQRRFRKIGNLLRNLASA